MPGMSQFEESYILAPGAGRTAPGCFNSMVCRGVRAISRGVFGSGQIGRKPPARPDREAVRDLARKLSGTRDDKQRTESDDIREDQRRTRDRLIFEEPSSLDSCASLSKVLAKSLIIPNTIAPPRTVANTSRITKEVETKLL